MNSENCSLKPHMLVNMKTSPHSILWYTKRIYVIHFSPKKHSQEVIVSFVEIRRQRPKAIQVANPDWTPSPVCLCATPAVGPWLES